MGIRQFFKDLRAGRELRATSSAGISSSGSCGFLSDSRTESGERVTGTTADMLPAYYQAHVVLSSSVSQLPLKVYQRTASGKEARPDHPVQQLLQLRPNGDMTAVMFRDSRMAWASTWGNGYAEIERDRRDMPVALWPIDSDVVTPDYDNDGNLVYEIQDGDGFNKNTKTVQARDMMHIPGYGFDGLTGRSVIQNFREVLGESLATQRASSAFWRNGARSTGILSSPNKLDAEQRERLRADFKNKQGGAGNTGKLIFLEGGWDYKPTSIPPEDAQYIQTRQWQVGDIARIFNMPPHKLGEMSRSLFSNIEQQNLDFVQMTLLPWLIRWEQELDQKMFTEREREAGYYVEHSLEALLRGDTQSRFNAYSQARQAGWMSVNEIRKFENMDPIDGGDIYLTPLNMAPADSDPEDFRAHREHIADALGRVVTKEVKAIRSYLDRDGFAKSAAAFYAKHPEHIVEVLTPAIRAFGETIGKDCMPYLKEFAQRHSEESLREMQQLGPQGAEKELRAWEQFTAHREAELIIEELTDGH
jgi:HK97 family phage portal protein